MLINAFSKFWHPVFWSNIYFFLFFFPHGLMSSLDPPCSFRTIALDCIIVLKLFSFNPECLSWNSNQMTCFNHIMSILSNVNCRTKSKLDQAVCDFSGYFFFFWNCNFMLVFSVFPKAWQYGGEEWGMEKYWLKNAVSSSWFVFPISPPCHISENT